MSKRCLHILIILIFSLLVSLRGAFAIDVYSFIKDPNDVRANIDSISAALLSEGGIEEAKAFNMKAEQIRFDLASDLYASALTTRVKLINDAKKNGVQGQAEGLLSKLAGSEDKNEILSNDIQVNMQKIAERLNSIVELEAKISVLEGVQAILPLNRPADLDEKAAESEEKEEGGE